MLQHKYCQTDLALCFDGNRPQPGATSTSLHVFAPDAGHRLSLFFHAPQRGRLAGSRPARPGGDDSFGKTRSRYRRGANPITTQVVRGDASPSGSPRPSFHASEPGGYPPARTGRLQWTRCRARPKACLARARCLAGYRAGLIRRRSTAGRDVLASGVPMVRCTSARTLRRSHGNPGASGRIRH